MLQGTLSPRAYFSRIYSTRPATGQYLVALLAASVLAYSTPGFAQHAEQPNVLLIYADDLGYGDLASFGHPVIRTPNLDELARQGASLVNYYAPSALCSPSRASLLTGRHPYRTGIESWIPPGSNIFLRDREITLAELLSAAGYQTALIGKWHLNSDLESTVEPQPTDQGFDDFYGHNAFQIPTNRNPTNLYRGTKALGKQQGYTAELYAEEAIAWLTRRDPAKPFFLYLSMAEPHTSIENPPEFNAMYEDFTKGPIVPVPNGLAEPPKGLLRARGPGEYFANVTYMDHQLGRVFEALETLNVHERTIVIFASDNGPVAPDWLNWWEVNSYGDTGGLRGRKHFLYEGGIKVPAIVRYPGVTTPGSRIDTVITGTDLFTTIASAAGAKIPDDRPIDGVDVRPALMGLDMPERTLVWALSSRSELVYAVRIGSRKLLADSDLRPRELYDLDEDPMELFNLIDSEREVAGRLEKALLQWIDSIENDPVRPRASGADAEVSSLTH